MDSLRTFDCCWLIDELRKWEVRNYDSFALVFVMNYFVKRCEKAGFYCGFCIWGIENRISWSLSSSISGALVSRYFLKAMELALSSIPCLLRLG